MERRCHYSKSILWTGYSGSLFGVPREGCANDVLHLQSLGQQYTELSCSEPLYLAIAREARTWGTPTQLGLEVGTADSTVLAAVRAIAPERLILARSIWQESVDLSSNAEGWIEYRRQRAVGADATRLVRPRRYWR